jgi:hypothetical protein
VFWHTFGMPEPDPTCLAEHVPSAEALAAFADYRAMVANPRHARDAEVTRKRRYLSKNNNNLLRLQSLCADPTASVLLVFRDPAATAASLHRQHMRFCAAQREDRFTQQYMRWLGHHEFGLDHRPFCFAAAAAREQGEPDDPNYWLAYWTAVYEHVLAQDDIKVTLVDHDALCAGPQRMLEAIFRAIGVNADAATLAAPIASHMARPVSASGLRTELLEAAQRTHRRLQMSPHNVAGVSDRVGTAS